jgi:hypothetical protein
VRGKKQYNIFKKLTLTVYFYKFIFLDQGFSGEIKTGSITNFGPSGVRALPLAAGINEGGHYFRHFDFFLPRHHCSKPKNGLL